MLLKRRVANPVGLECMWIGVVPLAIELDDELPLRPVHVDGEAFYDDVEVRLRKAGARISARNFRSSLERVSAVPR